MSVAAIDCGTNSCRLLILDDAGRTVTRERRVVRLGQGVDESGRLADEAVERTLVCLRDYKALGDLHGVTRWRMATTSASRDAGNRDEFFRAAEAVLGVAPELLSGASEGRLAFLGATQGLVARLDEWGEPALDLVVDIGGGSTEFVVGRPGESPVGSVSVDTGCVRLTEQFLRSDPPGPFALSQAISVVHAHLDDVVRELPQVKEASRAIGVAGTITTVAAVEIGMREYDQGRLHHFVLTRAAAEDVFRTLATESAADRGHNPGLPADRVDVIVAGTAILVAVMRRFEIDSILVSTTNLLDALAASLMV